MITRPVGKTTENCQIMNLQKKENLAVSNKLPLGPNIFDRNSVITSCGIHLSFAL